MSNKRKLTVSEIRHYSGNSSRTRIRKHVKLYHEILNDMSSSAVSSSPSVLVSNEDKSASNSILDHENLVQSCSSEPSNFQDNYSTINSSCSLPDVETVIPLPVVPDSKNVPLKFITEQLVGWSLKYNIPNVATSDLLHILNLIIPDLPKDARTLLKTPRVSNIESSCGGLFKYFGLEENIVKRVSFGLIPRSYPIMQKLKNNLHNDNLLIVSINVDGLPLHASSKKSFWPLLGTLDQAVDGTPFIIAIYFGDGKPCSVEDYFKPFAEECISLEVNGISIENVKYVFRVSCLIADAPARAFAKCIFEHNSLSGCEKCSQKGLYCKGTD